MFTLQDLGIGILAGMIAGLSYARADGKDLFRTAITALLLIGMGFLMVICVANTLHVRMAAPLPTLDEVWGIAVISLVVGLVCNLLFTLGVKGKIFYIMSGVTPKKIFHIQNRRK